MRKITEVLNSPLRIGAFALGIIIVACAVAFASMQVGASVNANKAIGLDKGVNVALQDAGFKSEDVAGLTAHYDSDDGVATYEVEFVVDGVNYEYKIKAADGSIIEANRENAEIPTIKGSEVKFEDPAPQVQDEPAKTEEPKTEEPKTEEPVQQQAQTQQQQASEPASKYIGVDKAKSIALSDAGLKSSEATFTKAKLDKEDGVAVYEIEFFSGNAEYEYEISAASGNIRDKDFDYEDEWDD